MKELIPVITDDLDLVEKNIRTPADLTRTITDGTRIRELELTQAHSDELDEFLERNAAERTAFLERYMRAGRPADKMIRPPGQRRTGPRGPIDPKRIRRNVAIREFSDAFNGDGGRDLSYRSPAGWIGYSQRLQKTFDAYQAGEDWRAVYDNWKRLPTGQALYLHEARLAREAAEAAEAADEEQS